MGVSKSASADSISFVISPTSLVTIAARSATAVATTIASTASVVFERPSRTPACFAVVSSSGTRRQPPSSLAKRACDCRPRQACVSTGVGTTTGRRSALATAKSAQNWRSPRSAATSAPASRTIGAAVAAAGRLRGIASGSPSARCRSYRVRARHACSCLSHFNVREASELGLEIGDRGERYLVSFRLLRRLREPRRQRKTAFARHPLDILGKLGGKGDRELLRCHAAILPRCYRPRVAQAACGPADLREHVEGWTLLQRVRSPRQWLHLDLRLGTRLWARRCRMRNPLSSP
jgi:hypothetical protein